MRGRSPALRFAAVTACGLAAFGEAREASANIAAPIVRESMVGQPAPLTPTKLAVASEDLSFDCYTRRAVGECVLRAAYRVKNATSARERVDVAFATYDASEIKVVIDGGRTSTFAVPVGNFGAASKPVNARVGFALDVVAGATREVVVTGVVPLGRIHQPRSYTQPPAKAWHPWAGMAADYGSFTLDYLMAPINTWASVGEIAITVRHASWWSLRGRVVDRADVAVTSDSSSTPLLAWGESRDGNEIISTARVSGNQRERLAIELTPLPPIIENGGGFLAVGGRPGAHGGLRTRVGYEVALRQIAMLSLAVESDLSHIMQIVPALELATPSVFIFPSVGVGLGTAIQVKPDVRAGVRVEGSVHWFPVGFVTAVDFFPVPNKAFDPSVVRVTLLGQFSF